MYIITNYWQTNARKMLKKFIVEQTIYTKYFTLPFIAYYGVRELWLVNPMSQTVEVFD